MFFDRERYLYQKPQLIEVICQLRYPTILSIPARDPVDFQEAIRQEFPQYKRTVERPAPNPGQPAQEVVNFQFLSADGLWRVNLTADFIALATNVYTKWEDFAAKLDRILAAFIRVYHPAYFHRVGLRYVNAFSRKALGLEGVPFRELFQPGYLGLLGEDDVQETAFARAGQDIEMKLPGGCSAKMHAGPGMVQRGKVKDEEVRFILDIDIFMSGNVPVKTCVPALNTVHIHADRIFAGAMTRQLHEAMEPEHI